MDYLETFELIHEGGYEKNAFKEFCETSMTNIAKYFALNSNTAALELIFKRHSYLIFDDLLDILSCIPETISPENYTGLLPNSKQRPTIPYAYRKRDIYENEEIVLKCSEFSKINQNNYFSWQTEYVLEIKFNKSNFNCEKYQVVKKSNRRIK